MYMVRTVMQCEPGKVGGLVGKFKALNEVLESLGHDPFRIYTDVSGVEFWTMVLEHGYGSLDEWRALEAEVMSDERARAAMDGYHDLVRSGRREFYTVEA